MALLLTAQTLRHHHAHPPVSSFTLSRHQLAPLAVAAGTTVATGVALDQVKSGKPKTVACFLTAGAGGLAAWKGNSNIVAAAGVGAFSAALWTLLRKGDDGRRSILLPFG